MGAASSSLRLHQITQCDDSRPAPPAPPSLPPPEGGASPPPPPPADAKDADSISEAAEGASAYTSPGPYEQAAMDCKRLVMLDTHDGFRCDISKQMSPYMAVVHSFWLGTGMIPDGRKRTYSFVTQVADEQGLFMARLDPERQSVDGRIHKPLLGGFMGLMGKLQASVSAEGQTDQLLAEVDMGGDNWTGNLKYGSMGGGIVYGANYFQSITPRLSMGGEGMYVSVNQALLSNYTIKYTWPAKTGEEDLPIAAPAPKNDNPNAPPQETEGSSTLCANWSTQGSVLTLNYKRVVTPNRVALGAELSCNPLSLESEVKLGAEFKLSRSRVHIGVDGDLKMQSIVEAKLGLSQQAPTLNFSADLDHLKDEMRFGFGLNIDSQ